MKRRYVQRPAQRDVRNLRAFYAGETAMEVAPARRGPQPEAETNKAIAGWRNLKPRLVLERNKRRLAIPVGYDKPILLGWLMPGSPDWIGWESVTVTPDMVGRKVAVFVGLESKRAKGGVVSEEQEAFLLRLKDDGGISGVVRNAEDAEAALERWRNGQR